jgi:glutathione S-transferase
MNKLIIGNKNYSSWSLRPWILMKQIGIPFEEVRIPLFEKGYKDEILKHSPSGKVPALCSGSLTVWDSLAICENVAEVYPEKKCWPEEMTARSMARSVSHEMHSGFLEIRNTLLMNCKKQTELNEIPLELQSEIDRICEIWRSCRQLFSNEGNFLFGQFSIADAMYAPIVLRFKSYGIRVGEREGAYMKAMMSLDSLREWVAEAVIEKESIAEYDAE